MVCTHTNTKYACWVLELIEVGYQVCTVDPAELLNTTSWRRERKYAAVAQD